jgi:4-hydroxybenzoyl-CoA thioesterase
MESGMQSYANGGNGGACFSVDIPVRFAHCDAAGIVFYPRYYEMMNGVVEDWCAQGLGISFRELHLQQGLGFPAVRIQTEFTAPSELGDLLYAELSVLRIGNASLTVAIRLFGPQRELRVAAELVLVMMDLGRRRAVAIPAALRERMAGFCSGQHC